jgi:DNA-binding CsgD family transcriptional regulator
MSSFLSQPVTVNELTERFHSLTPRQRQVLRLTLQERICQEIADELHISLQTVMGHRKAVLKTLGLKGKVDFRKAFHALAKIAADNPPLA